MPMLSIITTSFRRASSPPPSSRSNHIIICYKQRKIRLNTPPESQISPVQERESTRLQSRRTATARLGLRSLFPLMEFKSSRKEGKISKSLPVRPRLNSFFRLEQRSGIPAVQISTACLAPTNLPFLYGPYRLGKGR